MADSTDFTGDLTNDATANETEDLGKDHDGQSTQAREDELRRERDARAQALTLEIVGDLPFAEVKPPENVLFVCKLNPVTEDEDLLTIFGRFGEIISCEIIRDKRTGDSLQYAFIEFKNKKDSEQAYFKMSGVLIDDHRIHVDFSQSVSRLSDVWRSKTNEKRRKHHQGGWGGVAELEKKTQYRKMNIESDESKSNGYKLMIGQRQTNSDTNSRGSKTSKTPRRSRSPEERPYNSSSTRRTNTRAPDSTSRDHRHHVDSQKESARRSRYN